ncbi:DUF885 domain-containing protein [Permianibacter sp. IMCC34836]|uniref:DUF885 domain-containing protein n=1 Tax=Permianibacter fluminis TaxID=2738515 RepID=UPI001555A966|nr:DUF885 domain-containing protein [Permianibacter fluminis]NQD37857.1 DUF885 domain-containing protein [Permianibacter fluminis]
MSGFRPLLLLLAAVMATSCSQSQPEPKESAADAAMRIAQEYVDGYYHQFPEEAYEIGYPDTPMDKLGDRSVAAITAWQASEDGWLNALKQIDAAQLAGTPAAVPYSFTRDRLEAAAARRVCHTELWNVSPTYNGWQSMLASTFAQQPVSSDTERANALARLRAVAGYLDTEIANLKQGMKSAYLAPRVNVAAVIRQVDALLASAPESSPFFDPAARATDEAFTQQVRTVVVDVINPAMVRYRDFLAKEYQGRDAVGVTANADGAACYAASVRFHTSLAVDAQTIHDTGLREMARIENAMAKIAHDDFQTDDVKALLEKFRSDPQYAFKSEEDVLSFARAAVSRAEVAVHDWFGFVPKAEVIVKPFPAYQKASGGGFYASGSVDGSRPGTYELGTFEANTISKVGAESTAFHETYPGHHLQMAVAIFGKGVHPVLRYLYVSSMAEGWGLYSEQLADEMKLYSTPADRMGMLSNQALRAARLVVDSGMHALGWSREQAIDYMLAHTAEQRAQVESEVNRYLAVPAQATAYMIGSLEIQRLRHEAEQKLGDKFDIKGFHDVILGDGAVTLPMLQTAVNSWTVERAKSQ